jgi:hypothetical protein
MKCYKCGSKDVVSFKYVSKESMTKQYGKNYHIALCKKCFEEDLNSDKGLFE